MSAFIVDQAHIDRIISTALAWNLIDVQDATPVGRTLWVENLKSVKARYPEDRSGERPGRIGLTDKAIKNYQFVSEVPPLTPVEMIKAIACLDYQSCEHDTWPASTARKLLDEFEAEAASRDGRGMAQIRRSHEYDLAPWGFR